MSSLSYTVREVFLPMRLFHRIYVFTNSILKCERNPGRYKNFDLCDSNTYFGSSPNSQNNNDNHEQGSNEPTVNEPSFDFVCVCRFLSDRFDRYFNFTKIGSIFVNCFFNVAKLENDQQRAISQLMKEKIANDMKKIARKALSLETETAKRKAKLRSRGVGGVGDSCGGGVGASFAASYENESSSTCMSANSLLAERSSLSKSKVKLGSRYSVVDAKSKRMAKLFELGGISFDENESLSGIPMTRWSDDDDEEEEEERGGNFAIKKI